MASYTSIGDSYQAAISCDKISREVTRPPRPFWWDSTPLKNPRRKQNNPISNLSHWYLPSCEGGQNPSCRDLTWMGCQWVGWWNLPDLLCQLHFSKSSQKKWLLKWEKGNPPLFVKAWDIICLGSLRNPIDQETEHTSHSQATSTRTHATEGFRP